MTIKGVQYEVIRKMKLPEGQQVWRMTSLQTPEDDIQYDLVKTKDGEWILYGQGGRVVAQGKGNFARTRQSFAQGFASTKPAALGYINANINALLALKKHGAESYTGQIKGNANISLEAGNDHIAQAYIDKLISKEEVRALRVRLESAYHDALGNEFHVTEHSRRGVKASFANPDDAQITSTHLIRGNGRKYEITGRKPASEQSQKQLGQTEWLNIQGANGAQYVAQVFDNGSYRVLSSSGKAWQGRILSSRSGVKSMMQKEYILWGVPEGETDQLHAKVLSTQAKTPSEMEDIKRRAGAAGWHSFRVQILDPDKPTRMFSRTRTGNTSMMQKATFGQPNTVSVRKTLRGNFEVIYWKANGKEESYSLYANEEMAKEKAKDLARQLRMQFVAGRSRFGIAERVLGDGSVHLDFKVFRESLGGKSDSSLNFIMRDAADARDAMGPDGKKFNYYADIVNEVGDEISRRKNGKSRSNRLGDRKQSFGEGDSFMVEAYVGEMITGGRSARTMEEAEHYANAMLANIKRSAGGKPVKVEIQEIKAYSPQGVVKTLHSRSNDPVANMVMKLKSKIARETPREGTENFHKQVLRELDSILSDIKDNNRNPEVQQLDMQDVQARLEALAPRGSAVMRELMVWKDKSGFTRGESEISTRFGSIASKLGFMPDSITESNGVATLKFAQADGSAGRCAFAMISPLTGIVQSDCVTATDTEVRVQFACGSKTTFGSETPQADVDPRDKNFEKLKTMKGVTHQGRGFYIIPAKLLEGSSGILRYREVKQPTNRFQLTAMGDLVGWGSGHPQQNDYRLKDWQEAFPKAAMSRIGGKAEFGSDVILEDIGDDQVRATARVEGRSAGSFDGPRSQSAQLLLKALKIAGQGHEVSSGVYDMTHITLNDAAKRAMPKSAMMSRGGKAEFAHANQQIADGVAQLLSVLGFAEMAAEAKTTTDAETLKRYINVARSRFKGTDQADRVKVLTDKLERMLMSRA